MLHSPLGRFALLSMIALSGTLAFAAPASSQSGCRARFSCSPGYSPYCWFRIFWPGGSRVVTVPAGGSVAQYGLRPGATYCYSNRGVPGYGCARQYVKMSCGY